MTTGWTGATRWLAGRGAVENTLRQAALGPRPVLVFDAGAAATPTGAGLLDRVRRTLPDPPVTELAVRRSASGADLSALSAAWSEREATGVVAVGGGCTLDVAVLAALPVATLRASRLHRGRGGLVVLTPATTAALPTVAVPTTLGTGAEVSASACCERAGDGKLLVLGDALRPAYAAVDPAATAELPEVLVREALVEILARILVPYCARPVGEAAVVATADALSLASLRRLAAVASDLLVSGASDAVRLAIAAISAHSHAGWCNVGRPVACSPVWPVATELAALTGVTKAAATGYLLPAWAAATGNGDERWGDADRLRAAWSVLGEASGSVIDDPERGLAALVERWAGPAAAPAAPGGVAALAAAVGERAARRWGTGLPMLARFRPDDIAGLVSTAGRRPAAVPVVA